MLRTHSYTQKGAKQAAEAAARAQEALEARFRLHQRARVEEILAELSAEDLEAVRKAVSHDIPIPAVAQQWKAVDRDLSRIDEMKRAGRSIIETRLHDAVLSRWGQPQDRDIALYQDQDAGVAP